MVGIEQAFWSYLGDHLHQLPSQIHRILYTGVEGPVHRRVMHVCGVASQ
jgi:hypothetical protein